MLIDSVFGLSLPDPAIMEQRLKKVAELKAKMGNFYLLAKPIQRKQNGNKI